MTPEYYQGTHCRSELHRLVLDLATMTVRTARQLLQRTVEVRGLQATSHHAPCSCEGLSGTRSLLQLTQRIVSCCSAMSAHAR